MGMNGAFAAISDDSSSAYWNPAGLASSWYKELSFTRANLYDLDLIINNTLNISAPETSKGAMSFSWNRMDYEFESWKEDAFVLSYAKTIVAKGGKRRKTDILVTPLPCSASFSLSCGLTLKYLKQTSNLEITPEVVEGDGIEPIFCEATGMGLDVGLLARILAKDGRNRLSIGIAAQDIPTIVRWNSGELETEEYAPYRYQIGCSMEPIPRLTIACDVVGEQNVKLKEIHFGMEHWIFPMKRTFPVSERNLAIRGGIAKQLSASERMTFAGGIGIRWASWQLDYAYLMDSNGLGDTRNRFSVSVRF